MTVRKKIDERLGTVPKELRDPPVAFAAAALLGPLFIVLLALAASQNDVSSPLYSLAVLIFVGAIVGFIVTSFRRLKVRRAEEELWEEERALRRHARRPSASLARSPSASEHVERADERRAS